MDHLEPLNVQLESLGSLSHGEEMISMIFHAYLAAQIQAPKLQKCLSEQLVVSSRALQS